MTKAKTSLRGSTPELSYRTLHPDEASNPNAALDLVLVVEPHGDKSANGLASYFAANRQELLERLRDHGTILFRGFDVSNSDFEHIVSKGFESDRYIWMFPFPAQWVRWLLAFPVIGWLTRRLLAWIEETTTGRDVVEEKLSTLANDQTIQFPHHEYGIFFNVPHVVAFYCDLESELEGETLICDAKAGYTEMPSELRTRFESTRYIRYRSENQWYLPPFTAPAILEHPMDGHPTMNFTAYHHEVFADIARTYFPESTITTDELDETFTFTPTFVGEDGSHFTLDVEEIAALSRAHLEHVVLLPWKQGDLLLMDNFRVVHGRLNAGYPKRKVLQVMLCDYIRNRNQFTF